MKRWVFDEVQNTCPRDWVHAQVPNAMNGTLAMTDSNDHPIVGAPLSRFLKVKIDRWQCNRNFSYRGIEKFKQLILNKFVFPKRMVLQISSGGVTVFKKTTPNWKVI